MRHDIHAPDVAQLVEKHDLEAFARPRRVLVRQQDIGLITLPYGACDPRADDRRGGAWAPSNRAGIGQFFGRVVRRAAVRRIRRSAVKPTRPAESTQRRPASDENPVASASRWYRGVVVGAERLFVRASRRSMEMA
jgi:hypothetical protein